MIISKYVNEFNFPSDISDIYHDRRVLMKLQKKRELILSKEDVPKHTFCSICVNMINTESHKEILNMLYKTLYFGNKINYYLIEKKYPKVRYIHYGDAYSNLHNDLESNLIEKMKNKMISSEEINNINETIKNFDNNSEIFRVIKKIHDYYKDKDKIKYYCSTVLFNICLKFNYSCLKYE